MIVYGVNGQIDHTYSNYYEKQIMTKEKGVTIHVNKEDLVELKKYFFNFKVKDVSINNGDTTKMANINFAKKEIVVTNTHWKMFSEYCMVEDFKKIKHRTILKFSINILTPKLFKTIKNRF